MGILNVEVPMVEMGDTLNVNVPKLKSIQKRVPSRRHWKTIKRINWNETQHRIIDDEKEQQLMGRKKRANAIKPLPPTPEMDDAEQKMDELDLLERMCTFGVNLQGEVWRQQDLMNEVVEEIINDENPQLIK